MKVDLETRLQTPASENSFADEWLYDLKIITQAGLCVLSSSRKVPAGEVTAVNGGRREISTVR